MMDQPDNPDDPFPLRGGTCPTHGYYNNFSGRCLHTECAHKPGYEGIENTPAPVASKEMPDEF